MDMHALICVDENPYRANNFRTCCDTTVIGKTAAVGRFDGLPYSRSRPYLNVPQIRLHIPTSVSQGS